MKSIQIFEPAMCCATGVCGPGVNPELIRITGAVGNLQRQGYPINRYNLANDPAVFVESKTIHDLLESKGVDVLPATFVDGQLVKERMYPTNQELADWTGVSLDKLSKKPQFRIKLNVNN
jgi:hypothetical protein